MIYLYIFSYSVRKNNELYYRVVEEQSVEIPEPLVGC